MANIESLIRQYVILPSHPSTKGWYPILCKVCNDHGKKGPRGGFCFTDNSFDYNCFNCGHKAHYDTSQVKISKNVKTLFSSFNIPLDSLNQTRLSAIGNQKEKNSSTAKGQPKALVEETTKLLPSFTPIDKDNSVWSELAIDYLQHVRGISPEEYPFYVCSSKKTTLDKMWYGRLIIPFFNRNNEIISYQGRALVDTITPKYRTHSKSDLTIYGYENLYNDNEKPLFIVEGFFDAFCIKGVAILGNMLNSQQINIINSVNRRKIYIPDLQGGGWRTGNAALKAGWELSFPDFGSCKDVNEAYVKYGKLYLIKTIMDNTCSGMAAQIRLKLLKSQDKNRR